MAKEELKKKKRSKPYIRYEREHTMSAGHIDWYDSGFNNTKFCAILDDVSRKIRVVGEFQREDTDNSILLVDQMVERYGDILPINEY